MCMSMHMSKTLVDLTYDIRQALEQLKKEEKANMPIITGANNLSPSAENTAQQLKRNILVQLRLHTNLFQGLH